MTVVLRGICSMATRQLLAQLERESPLAGVDWHFEAVGGVDAARRVAAGELFDLVVLAADAIDRLAAGGHLLEGSARQVADSPMAIATQADAAPLRIDSVEALHRTLLEAGRIGYSTGPSGVALMSLFERWDLQAALHDRLVQAPPGVPVASLIADRRVALGFQQFSELMDVPGVAVLGPMPPGLEIVTSFSGAIAAVSTRTEAARRVLDHLVSDATAQAKRRHGLQPPA